MTLRLVLGDLGSIVFRRAIRFHKLKPSGRLLCRTIVGKDFCRSFPDRVGTTCKRKAEYLIDDIPFCRAHGAAVVFNALVEDKLR